MPKATINIKHLTIDKLVKCQWSLRRAPSGKPLAAFDQSYGASATSVKCFRLRLGLTLIELLIVITIAGILASFITYSFTASQQRSRDARRRTDLDAIKKALELAKQDTQAAYYYRNCAGVPSCGVSLISPALTPIYIGSIPRDPRTNADYTYIPSGCTVPGCTGYELVSCLERSEKPLDNPTNTTVCPISPTVKGSYTVKPN